MTTTITLDPQWEGRRRLIWSSWAAAFAVIIYGISQGPSTAQAVVGPAFIFAGIVVTAYIGGASYEAGKGVPGGNVVTTTSTPASTTTTTTTPKAGGAP
jgi:hypothetical protein